ncbi:MAG: zincin-like metallopeptidase domain-containing protein [Acidobacteriota bacterium]|nr:zincin-like metallopeptidase domain-containing protein [Acidobacteriota bacterium]
MAKPDKHRERAERYHKEFAAQLIKQVEKGTAPWQKSWKVGERIGPRNLASDRPYSGSNTVRLMAVATDKGYSDSRWATYEQIQAVGGQVRKGERGTRILSFKSHRRVEVKDDKGTPVKDENGKQVYRHEKLDRPLTRIYTVFNVEQARGIKPEPRPEPAQAWKAHKRAEDVIKASGVPVKHVHGDRAYYSLPSDQVVLPEKVQFPSSDTYYQTALHELGHASGHPDRLNRDTLQQGIEDGFGSQAYAREELRAEISAMMTGDRLGTGHDPSRGAAYVSSWVQVLDKNPKEILNASAEAQRMSNYLVSRTREREQDQGQKTHEAAAGQQQEPRYVEQAKQPTAAREPDSPTHRHQDDHRGAHAGRPKEPGRTYHVREVSHRPGVYTIEDTKEPDRLVPSPYGRMYTGKAEAEEGMKRLVEAQDKGGRWPDNYTRAAQGRIVEAEPTFKDRGSAARVTSPFEGGVVRGAGRPGVQKDQFPSRGGPER